ncbi:UDP-glucose 4-epimerase GalE [Prochlorococcus marinus]|uniref:UDP-glucose 4-epimerase GalE n=1 Tax=Prochlorococcus marinus TaxID=1219 RepID=UPI001ADD05EA|nr:UDP-glucose 4-epimerase GalE [Prochlorococcus marinus]MBO8219539.1 UDP-glucose 4-epimerase GalE [Prochlorococcus marinus CUG1416]MBW3051910.1 UDP-glucose 4-epimerase GalE [Prochlorococcus marinus str. MU1416]
MKKVLVTGGCGFIGSNTSLALLEKGYELLIVDSFVNSYPIVINKIKNLFFEKYVKKTNKIKLINCDLKDRDSLEKAFEESNKDGNKISAVIHFAGLKAVSDSLLDPLSYWTSNVLGTVNLLNVMEKFECRTLVFSSSATIYGTNNSKENLKENHYKNPLNPYGMTKETIEKILNNLNNVEKNDWRIAILRYFNPIGAHTAGELGESPKNTPNNIMPIINSVALGKRGYLNIFGNNWNTPDGTPIRDYIHVMDLADGHIKALEYLCKNSKPNLITLNLGTGIGKSVLQLINIFEEVNKISIPYRFASRRAGDIEYSVADNSMAKQLLNWEPHKDIKAMCKDSWNWVSKNPNGYSNR